jgi:hypothetical protein
MILSYENSAAAIPSSPTCSAAPCLGILNEPNIQHPNPERRCPHRHQPDTSYTLLASAAPPPIHHPKSRTKNKLPPKICKCVGLTPPRSRQPLGSGSRNDFRWLVANQRSGSESPKGRTSALTAQSAANGNPISCFADLREMLSDADGGVGVLTSRLCESPPLRWQKPRVVEIQ